MLSKIIAPVAGLVVSTAASIALDGVAKQLVPSDLKALPAFAVKMGVAVAGGLLASQIADIVVKNVNSVQETVEKSRISEEISPLEEEN